MKFVSWVPLSIGVAMLGFVVAAWTCIWLGQPILAMILFLVSLAMARVGYLADEKRDTVMGFREDDE